MTESAKLTSYKNKAELADVTRDSDTSFKVKRSKGNLQEAGAYCGGLPRHTACYNERRAFEKHLSHTVGDGETKEGGEKGRGMYYVSCSLPMQ